MMTNRILALALGVLIAASTLLAAEAPPWQRMLQGEDAKRAAELQTRIDSLEDQGKFVEAVAPAEALAALRKKHQGEKHWETEDAVRKADTLRTAANLPDERKRGLVEVGRLSRQAAAQNRQGTFAKSEGLYRTMLTLTTAAFGAAHAETAACTYALAANLLDQGKAAEAEATLRRALALFRAALGPRHPNVAATAGSLAFSLKRQGKFAEADPLYRESLALTEEVLGPGHPQTAVCYNNLARSLDDQGKAAEAEPLHRKALAIRRKAHGEEHGATAQSVNNLALTLDNLGKVAEAEALLRQALAVRQKIFPRHHPDVAQSLNNLAHHLGRREKYAEAEPLLRQALAAYEATLTPFHPDTGTAYGNLAENLEAQVRVEEAEPFHRKALAAFEGRLGPRHPRTADGYAGLADNLHAQGRYLEAEALHRRTLALREEALGDRHPSTASSLNSLGRALQAQRRLVEAEALYRRYLAITQEVQGSKHIGLPTAWNNLSVNLGTQGRPAEAEEMARRATAHYRDILGPRHSRVAIALNNLAIHLDDQGKYAEGEAVHREALALRRQILPPEHLDLAVNLGNLATNLNDQAKFAQAEVLGREALALHHAAGRSRHPLAATAFVTVGQSLQAQGKHEEAEAAVREALRLREVVLGPRHWHTVEAYLGLAVVLTVRGRHREAEPMWRSASLGLEAARLRLASTGFGRSAAIGSAAPHLGHAACLAELGRDEEAWCVAERGFASGLLDDLTARASGPADTAARRRLEEREVRMSRIDSLLTPLFASEKLDDADRVRRDGLTRERAALTAEVDKEAVDQAAREVYPLDRLQKALRPDDALVFWITITTRSGPVGLAQACIVRSTQPPAWVRVKGSGPEGGWSADDASLPARLRDALAQHSPSAAALSRRLADQRLGPLAPHLNGVARLVVIPVGDMAGIPVEVLTDRHSVSYVPSATVYARLVEGRPSRRDPSLLALGDPVFDLPTAPPSPPPPPHGVLALQVLPESNAAKAGLKDEDILLAYDGTPLKTLADLQTRADGGPVPVQVWRSGKTLDLRFAPGRLGVSFHREPANVVLKQRQETAQLLVTQRGEKWKPLPGTRREVEAIKRLFPSDKTDILIGSDASEQRLDTLATAGKLKSYRLLHFATHGDIDRVSSSRSALLLARDKLPDELSQIRKGEKIYTGRLSVEAVSKWQLDADLVTLSACETGQGKATGGDGLLGFAHMFLKAGARSLVLSQWKVDDAATALLMTRFYENLLGKRADLKSPLPKGEAMREAQKWLRELPRLDAERLATRLGNGALRGTVDDLKPTVEPKERGERPYAHPYYWAAFSIFGDPE